MLTASFILSISSSLSSADTHSSWGFRMTNTSAKSIGIGSVGTSATPIRLTIFSTSGNSAFIMRSTFVVVSIVSLSELPGLSIVWNAISPSSSWGMNSPPILVNIKTVRANMATAIPTIHFPLFKVLTKSGSYFRCTQCTKRSPQDFFSVLGGFKNKADIIGTYVRQRNIAPIIANMNVSAIGLNILPSMPSRANMGKNTISIINCPKKAAFIIFFDALAAISSRFSLFKDFFFRI